MKQNKSISELLKQYDKYNVVLTHDPEEFLKLTSRNDSIFIKDDGKTTSKDRLTTIVMVIEGDLKPRESQNVDNSWNIHGEEDYSSFVPGSMNPNKRQVALVETIKTNEQSDGSYYEEATATEVIYTPKPKQLVKNIANKKVR